MFHTGNELPSFFECAFRQFRLFNPESNVYFLTDQENVNNNIFKMYHILEVDKDTMMEIFESKENVKKSVFAVKNPFTLFKNFSCHLYIRSPQRLSSRMV
jgi:hypothetical protein